MIKVLNNTKKYWCQYTDVTDIKSTPRDERERTCGVTSISMVTGEHPDGVLQTVRLNYGKGDRFQWESHLIDYLDRRHFNCLELTDHAYPKPRKITNDELEVMMGELIKGRIIFYHKKGHYQLMIGYQIRKGKVEFIFNDPAGDRKLLRYLRKKNSGHRVIYSYAKVKREKIYGSCWSVVI